ncbi:MAG TPA: ATP-grasp domain-containing protein [Dehalococcoidales bacterium]|nr:ATP-grasp domain-containing protein [Dehalococcoidales bacterium]
MKLKVALVYNQPEADRYHAMGESAAELGVLDEVRAVSHAISELKYECQNVALRPPISSARETLSRIRADVVFNLFEGFAGSPETEAEIASLLADLKLPFTGCPPQALGLALDKARTKQILKTAGIPTPDFQVLDPSSLTNFRLDFPCIVKPVADDASHGLSEESVVHDLGSLERQIDRICRLFGGQALVEEFIDGREFNTTVIGRGRLIIPAISEIVYTLPPEKPRLLTFESKWQEDSLYFKNTRNVCPASINELEHARISRIAKSAFRLTGCRGYARVDFRQNRTGQFMVLEVNPNPDISPGSGASLQIAAAGLSYTRFIEKVIRIALN